MAKIALVCTGLGKVWRGYERFTRDLFDLLREDLDITLFKGGGKTNHRERKFPHLRHDGFVSRLLGWSKDPYFYQLFTYALGLVPYLVRQRYALVHYSEPGLGNILYHARKRFKLGFRLLFSNGVGLSPDHCARADHIQELTDLYYAEAVRYGIPDEKLTCLPYGVHCKQFSVRKDRGSLRKEYGIPADKIVLLSVAAINRTHKRIDYLVREMSKLDDSLYLVVCGRLEDQSVTELADRLIPGRYKFITVPFEKTPEIYHLADLFVHTALEEGFCLALVEAMAAGLPVLAHNSPHFRWLIGSSEWLIDMSRPETLSARISEISRKLHDLKPALEKNRTSSLRRFNWSNLKAGYLAMYEKAIG